jgi:hypothetical protein
MDVHFLLPLGVEAVKSVDLDGEEIPYRVSKISSSGYVDLSLPTTGVKTLRIRY